MFSLRISGVISATTLKQVNSQLARLSLYRPAALAVIVNSPGGAAASSPRGEETASLRTAALSPNVRLCRGTSSFRGYMALNACKEIYVSPVSLVGSVGARMDLLSLKQLALKYDVERRTWASSAEDVHLRVDLLGELTVSGSVDCWKTLTGTSSGKS